MCNKYKRAAYFIAMRATRKLIYVTAVLYGLYMLIEHIMRHHRLAKLERKARAQRQHRRIAG